MQLKIHELFKKYQNPMIAGAMVIMAIFVFGPKKTEVQNKGKIVMSPQNGEGQRRPVIPDTPLYFEKPDKISWNMSNWRVPKTAEVMKIEEGDVSDNKIKEIASLTDSDLTEEERTENGVWLIKSKDEKEQFYFEKDSKRISYAVMINSKNEIERGGQELSEERIWKELETLIKSWEIMPQGMELIKESVGHLSFLYPIWEETRTGYGEAIKITANFGINKERLKVFEGNTVSAIYTRSGKLVKLDCFLPVKILQKEGEYQTWTEEELKVLPKENFKIYRVEAKESENDVTNLDKVKEINISEANLIYIYDAEKRYYLYPYIILEGSAWLNDKPVMVELIISAIKE